jgi:hypothetical protein
MLKSERATVNGTEVPIPSDDADEELGNGTKRPLRAIRFFERAGGAFARITRARRAGSRQGFLRLRMRKSASGLRGWKWIGALQRE